MLVAQRLRGAGTTMDGRLAQRDHALPGNLRKSPAQRPPFSSRITARLCPISAILAIGISGVVMAGGAAQASEFGPEFASASATGFLAPAPNRRAPFSLQAVQSRQSVPVYSGLASRSGEAKALEKPVALRTSFISETRLGLLAQDPWSPEAQTGALHGEVLFARPFQPTDPLMRYFTPQPHIGASFNLGSRTSFVFAGLTWNIDLSPRVFIEASFGGALHDGHRGGVLREDRAALGCSPLFRESASLGYRFSERLSFMATVEHYGNAGLCQENRGLTNIGARFGYRF